MAAAAFGAGIDIDQIFVGKVGQQRKTDPLAIDIRDRHPPLGLGIARHQRGHGGEDVLDLGVGRQRDEEKRKHSVEPPQPHAQPGRAIGAKAQALHQPGNRGAHRREPAIVPDHRIALKPDQPRRLEQEAGGGDRDQRPEKGPVLAPVERAVVVRVAGRTVGAGIVKPRQRQPLAPIHHVKKPGDHRRARHVHDDREDQVEPAMPEFQPGQRPEDVMVQRDDAGADEQQREAIEDPGMFPARRLGPPLDGPVAEHRADHLSEARPEGRPGARTDAAQIFADLRPDPIEENADRQEADHVEADDHPDRKILEQDAGHFLRVLLEEHLEPSFWFFRCGSGPDRQ